MPLRGHPTRAVTNALKGLKPWGAHTEGRPYNEANAAFDRINGRESYFAGICVICQVMKAMKASITPRITRTTGSIPK